MYKSWESEWATRGKSEKCKLTQVWNDQSEYFINSTSSDWSQPIFQQRLDRLWNQNFIHAGGDNTHTEREREDEKEIPITHSLETKFETKHLINYSMEWQNNSLHLSSWWSHIALPNGSIKLNKNLCLSPLRCFDILSKVEKEDKRSLEFASTSFGRRFNKIALKSFTNCHTKTYNTLFRFLRLLLLLLLLAKSAQIN